MTLKEKEKGEVYKMYSNRFFLITISIDANFLVQVESYKEDLLNRQKLS